MDAVDIVCTALACIGCGLAVWGLIESVRAMKDAKEAVNESKSNLENWAEIRKLCHEFEEACDRRQEALTDEYRDDDSNDGNGNSGDGNQE